MSPVRSPANRANPVPPWRGTPLPHERSDATILGRIRRILLRRRRLIAALLLCAATAIAVQQLTPAPAVTVPVLVAARDLPAGHTLVQADLQSTSVARGMVPDGALALSPAAPASNVVPPDTSAPASPFGAVGWLGRQLAGPVRRGEVLTDASLAGAELLIGAPAGSQAVPVRLSDPATVKLLHQGQLVTVVLSSASGLDGPVTSTVLAHAVPVLWTPSTATPVGALLPATESEGLVVVAATAEQAAELAGASTRGKVFLIIVS